MNRIFKVIWSKAKNCYVVASELAKSWTKDPKSNVISHALAVSVLTAMFSFGALQSVYAATIADYPAGFTGRSDNNWSATSLPDSTLITDWAAIGGDIAFRLQDSQVYVVTDGKFYQNEGRYRVLDESDRAFAGGTATGVNAIAIGEGATASSVGSVAIGHNTNSVSGYGGVYTVSGAYSTAIGCGAYAIGERSFALGNDAVSVFDNSVSIGNYSVTNAKNTVSFGHSATDYDWSGNPYGTDLNRRLTHVADGIDDMDVATWGQTKSEVRVSDNGNYVAGFSAS